MASDGREMSGSSGGIQDRIAIVTGASSGIGRATAIELSRVGWTVALAARNREQLEKIVSEISARGMRALAVPTDVRVAVECRNLVDRVTRELGPIRLLVNNAGFAVFDTIAESKPEDLEEMMRTNFFGAVHCTKAVLPQMIERRSGSIVNVSSIAGIMGYERMGGYSATKFALSGFTEALRDEMRPFGVKVSMVCPGTTETSFFVKAERGKMPGASRLILAIRPEKVARAIVRAAGSGTYRIVLPLPAAMYMRFKELFPRTAHALMRRVSRMIERKRD